MSAENVKVVRAALDAYNRGDWEGMLKYAAPGCELDWSRSIGPQRGVYTVDQLSRLNLAETFQSVRTDAQDFIDHEEHVVTPLIGYMRGRDGIDVTAGFTYRWTLRNDAVVRIALYQELQEALEAAGLKE
jgi:ketosteroid isomerase-like protein